MNDAIQITFEEEMPEEVVSFIERQLAENFLYRSNSPQTQAAIDQCVREWLHSFISSGLLHRDHRGDWVYDAYRAGVR